MGPLSGSRARVKRAVLRDHSTRLADSFRFAVTEQGSL